MNRQPDLLLNNEREEAEEEEERSPRGRSQHGRLARSLVLLCRGVGG